MLYNQRAEIILQQLKLQSTGKVNELSQILKVSVDTVRRDLKAMEQSGLIKCLRGGACLPDSVASLSHFEGREVIHSQLKRQAAKKALKLIKSGDLVAINSGTTNTILAQEMASLTIPFTVLTNNFAAANILMKIPAIRLIFIGGETDALEQSTFGDRCLREFESYYPDLAFLSINAVNYKDGFTDFRMNEIPVIRCLSAVSRQKIAVMDSSKLGKCSKVKVLGPDQVDLIFMDNNVPDEVKEQYHKKGILIQ